MKSNAMQVAITGFDGKRTEVASTAITMSQDGANRTQQLMKTLASIILWPIKTNKFSKFQTRTLAIKASIYARFKTQLTTETLLNVIDDDEAVF